MKLIQFVAAGLLCAAVQAGQGRVAATGEELRRQFADPPGSFRTMPFFVWNGEVTEAEIDRYVADYKAQGFGGFFVHPRVGLITPYLSERWFALFRYTVEAAKKAGLEVWIYDENPFPTGEAGGHVAAAMPESVTLPQVLTMRRVKEKAASCVEVVKAEDSSGEFLCFETLPGRQGRRAYPDLLLPGVTGKFLEVTMPGYERSVGSEFGKTVPGVFSDEPNIAPPGGGVRWTRDFFEQFERRRGYDAKPLLAALFEDSGDYRRVRHDYYLTLLELFIERFSKPYQAYAEKAGLLWTGHYWEHGWPSPNDGPDNMAMYAFHQLPGIDLLFNQFDEDKSEQYGNVRNVKELSSVVNQFERTRALCETWGGSGWEFRFEDMKRLADWQYALGVNFMNQHLSYGTLAGVRKYDWPQSFSYHDAWWKHMRVLNDHYARLSLALSAGTQQNRVVVLEPTTTAWMYVRPGKTQDPRLRGVESQFRPFLNGLEKMQVEYDLASENIVKDHGRVEGKRFVIGKRGYDVVVLPPGLENVDSPTAGLLERYMRAGGVVLSMMDSPLRVDGAASTRLSELAAEHAGLWRRARSLDDAVARELLLSGDWRNVSGMLFHQRRQLRDGELLFLVNSGTEKPAQATVSLNGRSVVQLDTLSGRIAPYPARLEGGRLLVEAEVPVNGSLLLLTSNSGVAAVPKPDRPKIEEVVQPSGRLSVERAASNVLRLDYCDLKVRTKVDERDIWVHQAMEKAYQAHGFDANPWWGTQFKSEFLDRDKFAADSGFEATFRFEVSPESASASMQAVVERPALWKVSVNGVSVQAKPGEWWLDRAFGVFDIGGQVKPGTNEIVLSARPMSVHAELQPVYILGDFGVSAEARGFRIGAGKPLALGAWKDQALPFYSDAVLYRQEFDLRSLNGGYKLKLGQWRGMVAHVKVNGRDAGIIGWQPYELDVTSLLRPGRNRVEVAVYGSLKNLLGPHLMKYRAGLVGSWLWRYAPAHQPPGSEYDLIGYGLFEAMRLVSVTER